MSPPWDQRIQRAEELADLYPFSQEVLRFYRELTLFQKGVYDRLEFGEAGDVVFLLPMFPSFLSFIAQVGPPVLASQAEELASRPQEAWGVLLLSYWEGKALQDGLESSPLSFFPRAFLQPYGEFLAERAGKREVERLRPLCPFCGRKPQVGCLKEKGEGAELVLVCSLCATEWNYKRISCSFCGEEDPKKLPYYQAEDFPHIQVGICEGCRSYLKRVDLTKDGRAVPVVDELASIPLDVWAKEQGYQKLELNLAGI